MAEAWKKRSDDAYTASYAHNPHASNPADRANETTAIVARVQWVAIRASSHESTEETPIQSLLESKLDANIAKFDSDDKEPPLKDPADAFQTAFKEAWPRTGADFSDSALSAAIAKVQVDTHSPLPLRRQHATHRPR